MTRSRPKSRNATPGSCARLPVGTRTHEEARAESGIGTGGTPRTASLARVTLGQYGEQLEPDPSKPSRIKPNIEDRLAWVITFADAPIPVFGPPGGDASDVVRQPLVAFVDPATGELLASMSY